MQSQISLYAVFGNKNQADPDVIRTRSLLIWSQTRYHCATESTYVSIYEKVSLILTNKLIGDAWRLRCIFAIPTDSYKFSGLTESPPQPRAVS